MSAAYAPLYDVSLSRCGWVSPFGRHCEKQAGHTGAHRCLMFSAKEAQRVFDQVERGEMLERDNRG